MDWEYLFLHIELFIEPQFCYFALVTSIFFISDITSYIEDRKSLLPIFCHLKQWWHKNANMEIMSSVILSLNDRKSYDFDKASSHMLSDRVCQRRSSQCQDMPLNTTDWLSSRLEPNTSVIYRQHAIIISRFLFFSLLMKRPCPASTSSLSYTYLNPCRNGETHMADYKVL